MVSEIADLGWLHRKINEEIGNAGMVWNSLRLAVKKQLSEYYRWVAIMENNAKNEILNLRTLNQWSYEPFSLLRWLAIILQAVKPFNGCQIISIINSHRPHGSVLINSLLNRLLSQLLQPLLHYIYNWCYKGELLDEHQ